ncbi:MAG TPA: hypothetical protein VMP41_13745, partial [Acidimicrobiales bacterium]|nr:hypothetical protein [Acidimicrobiales bacterium]
MWEQVVGLEHLVEADANRQPIDVYLWALQSELRRLLGATHLRLASNYADDTDAMGHQGREL